VVGVQGVVRPIAESGREQLEVGARARAPMAGTEPLPRLRRERDGRPRPMVTGTGLPLGEVTRCSRCRSIDESREDAVAAVLHPPLFDDGDEVSGEGSLSSCRICARWARSAMSEGDGVTISALARRSGQWRP
jgi:hypothetical protein